MTRGLASFLIPVLLAGTAAFLTARLIEEARMLGQAAAVETAAVGGDRLAIAPESDTELPEPVPADAFRVSQVLERPLFSPTRRPPVRAATATAPNPAADANLPDLQLHGIVVVGDARMALLGKDSNAAFLRVEAGDLVDDWRVLEIGPDEVVLRRRSETHRIRLDYRNRTE